MSAYGTGSEAALHKLGMTKQAFLPVLAGLGLRAAVPWLLRTGGSLLGRMGVRGAAGMAGRATSSLAAPGLKGVASNMAADSAVGGLTSMFDGPKPPPAPNNFGQDGSFGFGMGE